MPQMFDNIDKCPLSALSEAMGLSERMDFQVGDFNLRGWKQISSLVDKCAGGDAAEDEEWWSGSVESFLPG